MIICGLDISKNSPAVTKLYVDDSDLTVLNVEYVSFVSVKKYEKLKGVNFYKKNDFIYSFDQFRFMKDTIIKFIGDAASYCAIEDYAYSAAGKITELAEFTGLIKYDLYCNLGTSMRLYDIPSIKLYATGNGTSDKLEMAEAFNQFEGLKPDLKDFPLVEKPGGISPTSDIIDSFFIAQLLLLELKLRRGLIELKDLTEDKIKIFNRTTKSFPTNILARDFIKSK